jgi:hypothetical protein
LRTRERDVDFAELRQPWRWLSAIANGQADFLEVAAFDPDCDFALDDQGLCAIFRGARNGKDVEASEKSGN